MEDNKTTRDNKAAAKRSWPNYLTVAIIWDWLRFTRAKRLTKKQVLAQLRKHGYAPYYADLVKALAYMGKINEIAGQGGGIELRRDADLSDDEETQLQEYLSKLKDGKSLDETPPPHGGHTATEEDFYEPFADWLVTDLKECTRAKRVGGKIFGKKWATPDVIGIREAEKGDIIQFPPEIVSAEIKLDSHALIEAFGQTCAYQLFSHRSYIVVPESSQVDDLNRLDALCRIFGIGLILFDPEDPSHPSFSIRARAVKKDPDMSYANNSLRHIRDKLWPRGA